MWGSSRSNCLLRVPGSWRHGQSSSRQQRPRGRVSGALIATVAFGPARATNARISSSVPADVSSTSRPSCSSAIPVSRRSTPARSIPMQTSIDSEKFRPCIIGAVYQNLCSVKGRRYRGSIRAVAMHSPKAASCGTVFAIPGGDTYVERYNDERSDLPCRRSLGGRMDRPCARSFDLHGGGRLARAARECARCRALPFRGRAGTARHPIAFRGCVPNVLYIPPR
jgi:hypothetical protein